METGLVRQFSKSCFWSSGIHSAKTFGGTQLGNVVTNPTKCQIRKPRSQGHAFFLHWQDRVCQHGEGTDRSIHQILFFGRVASILPRHLEGPSLEMWSQTQPNGQLEHQGGKEMQSFCCEELGCGNVEKGPLGQFSNSCFGSSGIHSAKAFGGTQLGNVVTNPTKCPT